MLSICIPVFNVDVRPLVQQLNEQIAHADATFQLIVIDDASRPEIKKVNQTLASICTYVELPENIGRSAIRNRFLEYATQDFLLFLDCDAAIISADFLKNYVEYLRKANPKVVLGASVYQDEEPDKLHRLRWYYSVHRESKTLEQRLKNPDLGFKTNNFVIEKKLFASIRFDERLKNYGHEDTLFGFHLKERKIKIHHIDNPVLNKILDSNQRFLEKTEEGIRSLVTILQFEIPTTEFTKQVRLLSFYRKMKQNFLLRIFFLATLPFKQFIKGLLQNGNTNLRLFDLYKLMVLHKVLKQTKS